MKFALLTLAVLFLLAFTACGTNETPRIATTAPETQGQAPATALTPPPVETPTPMPTPATSAPEPTPAPLPFVRTIAADAVTVSMGIRHTMAITQDGVLWACAYVL